jgi:hypothetical protein
MEELVLDTGRLDEWREWYDRLDRAGPYHSPEYLDVLAGNLEFDDESAELYVLADGGEFVYYPYLVRGVGTAPFAGASDVDLDLDGYSDVVASWYYGGPLASAGASETLVEAFVDRFGEHCRASGVVAEFVRFDPNLGNHADFEALDPTFNRETVPVDLTGSREDVHDGFEKRNRNALRQARDSPLRVEPTTDRADWDAFYDIYTNAMDAKGATEHYRFPFEFFVELLESPLATLLVARYGEDGDGDGDGAVVGGSMLVHDEHTAHDYLRASNPDYWDLRVNNLICYEALMHMYETGRSLFDFQGGRPGVFKFKKSFSPERAEMYLARRVHMPEVYDELVEAAEATGIDTDTGYFPAYRVDRSN